MLADTATRHFDSHLKSASETVAKVSSGKRSPSPKYDAVSLAISNKLSSDIAALTQGVRNLSQGSAVLNIAASGIGQITEVMTRMKTLAVQASSDVLSVNEREYANQEFQRLSSTIDSLVGTVRFAGTELLANGKVKGAVASGTSLIAASAPAFGMSDDATDTNGFFDLHKTQKTSLASGYVNFNSKTDVSSVEIQDDGNIFVNLGEQMFAVTAQDIQPDKALTFHEVDGDSYFSLQLKADVSTLDTTNELATALRGFFGDENTSVYVGAQPPLSSGWTRVKYDTAFQSTDAVWTGGVGQWTLDSIQEYVTEDTLTVDPKMTGLSGPVEEVYSATDAANNTYAISIKVGNEVFLSTVDSLNSEVLENVDQNKAVGHKIRFQSLENDQRVISFELTAGIRDALTNQANPTTTNLTQALAEGIAFAIGAEALNGGANKTRVGIDPNTVTYTDLNHGSGPKIVRLNQQGNSRDAKSEYDATGFYTNFNTVDGVANPPRTGAVDVASIGNDFLLNTARTTGNIDGMVESVKVSTSSNRTDSFNIDVKIGGRTFIARGFRPLDQANLSPQTTVSHGGVNNFQISSSGFLDMAIPQSLDLVDVNNEQNRISLNLAHNAGTALRSLDALQNSMEELFGVGEAGKDIATAHFMSGKAIHNGVNGIVSGGSQGSIIAYPGAEEGTYYISYDAETQTFSMSGNGDNWTAKLSNEATTRNIVSFGNGVSLDLGRDGNEFDSSVSLGQFAVEVVHENIATYEYQAGGEVEDTISFKLGGLSAEGLGIDDLSVLSKEQARQAQRIIDGAIVGMNGIMTNLGSQQSFTEIAISNSTNVSIWTQATRADFADADLASELLQFNKETVLTQAAASMVTQAQQMFAQIQDILR